MFRYERREPYAPLPSQVRIPPAPLLVRESERYRHVFVVVHEETPENLFAGRALAQSVSDSVVRAGPRLLVASLRQTWTYFRSFERLRRTACDAWQQEAGEALSHVVVSGHLLRGFLFARQARAGGVLFATPYDLTYRRFCAALGWDEWLAGVRAFIEILALTQASRAEAGRQLARMVERLRDLRIASPGHFPAGLPVADLERRFGPLAALLWQHWKDGDPPDDFAALPGMLPGPEAQSLCAPLPPLRTFPEDRLAREAATRSDEIERYRDAHALPLSQLRSLARETIFACVEKVGAPAVLGQALGLKSFHLEIAFDNGQGLVRQVELSYPVYERNKHTEAIVERVLEALPTAPTEIPSETEPSLFYEVTRVEGVHVIPLLIARRDAPRASLFSDSLFGAAKDATEQDLAALHERVRVKDKAVPRSLAVSTSLEPFDATVAPALALCRAMARSALFRYAQSTRPLQVLARPLEFRRHAAPGLTLRFLESVGAWDYFLGFLPKETTVLLWLRAPLSERHAEPRNRTLWLLGLFETSSLASRSVFGHLL